MMEHSKAAQDVLDERRRQIEKKGYTFEHDDEHDRGDMAIAAGCYALNDSPYRLRRSQNNCDGAPHLWPWEEKWWKPKDRRTDLVRAAALIIAEIERLDRLQIAVQEGGAGGSTGDALPPGMVKISKMIGDLTEIYKKFGDTCVYIKPGVSWGSVAIDNQAKDERAQLVAQEVPENV